MMISVGMFARLVAGGFPPKLTIVCVSTVVVTSIPISRILCAASAVLSAGEAPVVRTIGNNAACVTGSILVPGDGRLAHAEVLMISQSVPDLFGSVKLPLYVDPAVNSMM